MQRQLYGLGSLVDREKFGLGSSLKKFVRKIIPNEVSKVATTVAPFIAPFDPATAAVMASVGSFDQTGSIGRSLKSGALTYGGGQLARYVGGAGFQSLPGTEGFTGQSLLSPSAYSGGIMGALKPGTARGLTSPIGTETGLGKFLSGRGTPGVKEVRPEEYRVLSDSQKAAIDQAITGGDLAEAEAIRTSAIYGSDIPVAAADTITASERVSSIMKGDDILGNAFELAKSGAKAAFTNKDGSIDKKAVIAAVAGAASFMEARAAAQELGTDITEEEYDEAAKAEKKAEYSGYLQNFFSGKKDGGRIPFANGSEDPAPISGDELKKIIEEFMKNQEKEEQLRKKYRDGTAPPETFESFKERAKNIGGSYGGLGELISDEGSFMVSQLDDLKYNKGLSKEEAIEYLQNEWKKIESNDYDPSGFKIFKNPGIKKFEDIENKVNEGYDKVNLPEENKVFAANGGRIKLQNGTGNMGVVTKGLPEEAYEQEDQSISYMEPKSKEKIFETLSVMEPDAQSSIIQFMLKAGKLSDDDYKEFIDRLQMGVEEEETRITKQGGGSSYTPEQVLKMKRILFQLDDNPDILVMDDENIVQMYMQLAEDEKRAKGGRIGKAVGGIMDLPTGQPRTNQQGVNELDYRQSGGFVPIGIKEKADDVPAMLSKNEFVMTADAVRGIGNGSVENGAQKLYNLMKEAEKVGKGVA